MMYFNLVPLVVLVPVAGLLINIAFGEQVGQRRAGWLASGASALAFGVALLQAVSLAAQPEGQVVPFAEWIRIGELDLSWAFRVDTLSVTMMLVVAGVGTLIHIYAVGYMHYDVQYKEDPGRFRRFFVYLNLFIAAMMLLVTGDNYLMLFVGWEGVGLCSFLLIGFWTGRNPDGTEGEGNATAAKKAFVTNRVGDFGFLIAMFITFWAFGSLQFDEVFEAAHDAAPAVIVAITLFMLLGVAGKSAQLPLFVWLPDAMAGPTPVSALIHAATMVTAGVYLVARSAPLFEVVPLAQSVVAWVGGLTALFAATIAVGQFDIKKVLAYSTISQLGFMVAAVGMGAFVAGMFHLVTHAFFKALLFLSAGSVIIGVERGHHPLPEDLPAGAGDHAEDHGDHGEAHGSGGHDGEHVFDPNDMRNMGGLRRRMPQTFWVYLIGALALAGIPPLAGFFSKDEILAEAAILNFPVYVLLTVAAFFTAFYMGRQVWMVFFGQGRTGAAEAARESPPVMTYPLIALAVLSVFGGGLNLPGIHTFTDWIEHTIEHVHSGEFNLEVAALSTALALGAIGLAWLLYGRAPMKTGETDPLRRILGPVFGALESKWWVDELYWAVILNPYIALSKFLADVIDWRFWHDWFHDRVLVAGFNGMADGMANAVDLGFIDAVANGLGDMMQSLAASMRNIQTGFVRNYALSVFIGVVLLVGYLVLR